MAIRSFLVAMLCASALAACSPSQAGPAGATCEGFGSTPSITQSRSIDAGAVLTLVLCSNPSTGYSWDDPVIGDPAVVEVVDRMYQSPEGSALPIVGAAGGEVLTIRGLAPGTTTLTLRYRQPWEGGAVSDWTYSLEVTVL